MIDLDPDARRVLAQAKLGQARASEALRARVRDRVERALARDAGSGGLAAASRFGVLPGWLLPTLGVLCGVAAFAAFRPAAGTISSQTPSAAADVERHALPAHAMDAATGAESRVDRGAAAERVQRDVDATLTEPAPPPQHVTPDATREQQRAKGRARSVAPPVERRARRSAVLVEDPKDVPVDAPAAVVAQAADSVQATVTPAVEDHLRAEMQLLSRAEASLRTGDPRAALQALEAHAQQYQGGQLFDEREGLRLIALCALSRDPSAALTRYLHANGDGVLHARVRETCARFVP